MQMCSLALMDAPKALASSSSSQLIRYISTLFCACVLVSACACVFVFVFVLSLSVSDFHMLLQAQRAIAELNDTELMGRMIFVREDREQR